MKEYEITYLLADEALFSKKIVENAIENLGGNVTSVKPWGQRNLAYPIRKLNTAFYATIVFELETTKIKKLNRQLLLEPDLMRFLIVNDVVTKELEEEAVSEKKESLASKKEEAESASVKPEKTVSTPTLKTSKAKQKEAVKKTTKKESTPLKKKTVVKKKEAVSDTERLKQLENKLQDLLKE